MHTTHTSADIVYRERTPKLDVENRREILGDGRHQINLKVEGLKVKSKLKSTWSWDAVGAAVGITRFLNIAYAMFIYHVSEKGKL